MQKAERLQVQIDFTQELFTAIKNGDIKQITVINKKHNVSLVSSRNESGDTTLMAMCSVPDHKKAETMIKAFMAPKTESTASSVNAETKIAKKSAFINLPNKNGITASMFLAMQEIHSPELLESMKVLITYGAKLELTDCIQNNVAHYAAISGNCPMLQLLLDSTAKQEDKEIQNSILFARNNNGLTPMDLLKEKLMQEENIEEYNRFVESNNLLKILEGQDISFSIVQKEETDQPSAITDQIIDTGRNLKSELEKIQFVLSNENHSHALAILFSEWFDTPIKEENIIYILDRMKKIAVHDQYSFSSFLGIKPTFLFSYLKQAVEEYAKEQVDSSNLMTQELVENQIHSLKDKSSAEKMAFFKKHKGDLNIIKNCIEKWYDIKNLDTSKIADIFDQAESKACEKMSTAPWILGYKPSPESLESCLHSILGCNSDTTLQSTDL